MSRRVTGVPSRSLRQRFHLNLLGYGYAQVMTLAVQLIQVPFFLGYWGTDRYADWLVLTGVPAMLVLLDFGIAQVLASRATIEGAGGDWDRARSSLQTAFLFTLALCAVLLILALSAGMGVQWQTLLGLETMGEGDARLVVLAMTGYLCASLLGGPLDAWLRTIGRAASSAFLLANRRLLDVALTLAVLVMGGGYVALAVTLMIGQCVAVILLCVLAVRWSEHRMFGVKDASWGVFVTTLKPGLAYMGFPLAQIVTLQGGLQVLNQVAPSSVVVAFTMGRTLMRLIIQVGVVANNALKPELSRLAGQGEHFRARKLSSQTGLLSIVVCGLAYVVLVALGPDVIRWWGHHQVTIGHLDLALIGAHALINVIWFVPAASLIAVNRHVQIATAYGVASCAALAVWLWWIDEVTPMWGAALILLVPELIALAVLVSARRREGKGALP